MASIRPSKKPSEETAVAWARLVRVQHRLLSAVEQDLKAAGFPPLSWYDALLELARQPQGHLRPIELEKQMTLPQYSTSRLIDRLVDAGYAERKICPVDGRGQYVGITPSGRALQKKMWDAYGRQSSGTSARNCRRAKRRRCAICSASYARLRLRLELVPLVSSHLSLVMRGLST